ncbi:hypothetical protein ACKGJO_00140 [Gracilimonas sp. Q87]|uniref:hypothetical protein n=1 Tax=Gracilimonas sp. Q87 TaxID=3384766 RepID=UPI0039840AF5
MVKKEKREVTVSEQFTEDLKSVYEYGEEIFGAASAKSFVSEIYSKIWSLDQTWAHHPECRHLPTKPILTPYILRQASHSVSPTPPSKEEFSISVLFMTHS